MPRFFFNFVHQGEWLYDRDGVVLSGLAAAHGYAMLLVDQATCRFTDAADWREWVIEITDESRRGLLTVVFPVVVRSGVRGSVTNHSYNTPQRKLRAECRQSGPAQQ